MQWAIFYLLMFFFCPFLAAQNLDALLKKYNSETIPYITVAEAVQFNNAMIFDTREKPEFLISHIPRSILVGNKNFPEAREDLVHRLDRKTPIIVYCSVGIRSEKIGEKLKKLGFVNVRNLYGGIFEWKNQGKTVVNLRGKPTDSVHAYSKKWSRFLTKGEPVY